MKKITLYIVDDDPEAVNALRQAFKPNKRYRVRGYSDLAELRQDLERFPPQLVICDYLMPECDGLQLLRELKQRFPRLRGILLTGEEFGPQIIDALEEGLFDYYFSKPWNLETLQETLQKLAREVAKEI
jgi:DNA-binding NtrC family response regulator